MEFTTRLEIATEEPNNFWGKSPIFLFRNLFLIEKSCCSNRLNKIKITKRYQLHRQLHVGGGTFSLFDLSKVIYFIICLRHQSSAGCLKKLDAFILWRDLI